MKIRTCNNSLTDIKDRRCSVKRINNLSNRIQSLQNDIDKIKNSKKKKNTFNNIKLEKNYSMVMNDSNIKKNLNDKFIINKTLVKNPYFFNINKKCIKYRTNNNSQRKDNTSNENSFIYKKIKSKNYNKLIHEKRNILLEVNSDFKKKERKRKIIKDISESNNDTNNIKYNSHKISYISRENNNSYNTFNDGLQSKAKNRNKLKDFLSVDKLYSNFNLEKKEKIEEKKDIIEKDNTLEIEFEIRNLKKRKKFLMKSKKDLEEKLILTKDKNKDLKNKIIKKQKYKKNIIDNLILINKEYLSFKNSEELDYFEDEVDFSDKNLIMKDIVFNMMDMKFEYDNDILFEKFIEGLNELFKNIPILNNLNISDNNISNKINRLLHMKNKLQKYRENYSCKKKGNNKYYKYFTSLLNELNLKSFEELKEYIKDIFIKNIQENKRLKDITHALINDSLLPEERERNPKMNYIKNASSLIKKEKKEFNIYNKQRDNSSNINANNGFRNKRKNSLQFKGLCYNSYLNINNKRNLYSNNIDNKFFRSRIDNDDKMSKFNYFYNDNDIHLLNDEEEKN